MVNAQPQIFNLDATVSADENQTILLDTNIDLVDAELDALNSGNGRYEGATLLLQRSTGAHADDVFGFDAVALAAAGFTITGLPPNLSTAGAPDIATTIDGLAFGAGGRMAIEFGADATSALVDALVRCITYRNTSNTPPEQPVPRRLMPTLA